MAAKKNMSRAKSMDPSRQSLDVDPNDASVSHSASTMREGWAGREVSSVAPAMRLSRSLTSPAMQQRSAMKTSFVRGEAISLGLGWTIGNFYDILSSCSVCSVLSVYLLVMFLIKLCMLSTPLEFVELKTCKRHS